MEMPISTGTTLKRSKNFRSPQILTNSETLHFTAVLWSGKMTETVPEHEYYLGVVVLWSAQILK
ncbi:MAG: hypothetical protein WBA22_12215 [Candidatus Methanofastidiosia archaeon]